MVEDLLNALISKHKGTVISKNWQTGLHSWISKHVCHAVRIMVRFIL